MKKHISVLMLDLSENFIVTLVACGVIIAMDLISFAISGYKQAGLDFMNVFDSLAGRIIFWAVWMTVIIFILRHYSLRKRVEEKDGTGDFSKPGYTAQRLLTSERMVYVWKAVGNMVRIVIVIALQVIMVYLMRMASQRMFPENYDALSSYVDLASGRWSGIFIPTAGSIMSLIAAVTAGGMLITWFDYATGGRVILYIILTVLIGLGALDIKSDASPMSAILYIGVGLVLFTYVLVASHTGRKPGKPGFTEEEQ